MSGCACTPPGKGSLIFWNQQFREDREGVESIHLIGIGGSAMAPLAGMLAERGYRVTGSDVGVYPPA